MKNDELNEEVQIFNSIVEQLKKHTSEIQSQKDEFMKEVVKLKSELEVKSSSLPIYNLSKDLQKKEKEHKETITKLKSQLSNNKELKEELEVTPLSVNFRVTI